MKAIFVAVTSFLLAQSASAGFTLDCGHPVAITPNIAGQKEVSDKSFKLNFNEDGKVYLLSTDNEGKQSRQNMIVTYAIRGLTLYFAEEVSVIHRGDSYRINYQESYGTFYRVKTSLCN